MKTPYDDILHLPRHVSPTRLPMPIENRAAQFSSFAALTGHGDAIAETARLTVSKAELSDSAIAELNRKLNILADRVSSLPEVAITHFVPDPRKDGGSYVTATGWVKKIDEYMRVLILASGEEIRIDNILDMDSEVFGEGESP